MKTIQDIQDKVKTYTELSAQSKITLEQLQTFVNNTELTREEVDICHDLLILLEDNTNNVWIHEFKDQLPQYKEELDYAFDSLLECNLKYATVDIEQLADCIIEIEDTEKYYNLKLEKETEYMLDLMKNMQLACIKLGTSNIVLDW